MCVMCVLCSDILVKCPLFAGNYGKGLQRRIEHYYLFSEFFENGSSFLTHCILLLNKLFIKYLLHAAYCIRQ